MAERQHAQRHIVFAETNSPIVHLEARGDVGEVQHHALGLAGGAGGVNERQQVVGPIEGFPATELLLALRIVRMGDEIPEVAGLAAAAQIDIAIEGDDAADGAGVQELERAIELGLLADEEQADARVAQDVADLVARARRVDGHRDTARGQNAEVGLRPFGHVPGADADHFARLVPGSDERLRAAVHGPAERPPAHCLPPAVHLHAHRRAVAERGDTLTDLSYQVRVSHQDDSGPASTE